MAAFLPPSLRKFKLRRGGRNLKLWYGDQPHEHFEVQIIRRGRGQALEVGFHSEHPSASRNDEVLSRLSKAARKLGKGAEAGPFIGYQSKVWRRLSEVWDDGDFLNPDGATDAAERLATYVRTIGPHLAGKP